MFFNLGGYEILVIAVVALIVIGPEQLPTVMRKVGRYAAQLRNMANGMRDEFMAGMDGMDEFKDGFKEFRDIARPDSWLGSGSDGDPVVPRGYAERQRNLTPAAGQIEAAAPAAEDASRIPADTATADADTAVEGDTDGGGTTARPAPFTARAGADAWTRPPVSDTPSGSTAAPPDASGDDAPSTADPPPRRTGPDVPVADRNGDHP